MINTWQLVDYKKWKEICMKRHSIKMNQKVCVELKQLSCNKKYIFLQYNPCQGRFAFVLNRVRLYVSKIDAF